MNHYCKGKEPKSALALQGQAGTLTEERFALYNSIRNWSLREDYCDSVSWAVFTVEFMDSLARLLKGRKVLEVCAGHGTLAKHMRARDINWTATDSHPPTRNVIRVHAITAVKQFRPDVIFASWIPYGSRLDFKLAKLGIPMILVGEGNGGCTGSDRQYDGERFNIHAVRQVVPGFNDVPRWDGIHDFTSLVLPHRMTVRDFLKGV